MYVASSINAKSTLFSSHHGVTRCSKWLGTDHWTLRSSYCADKPLKAWCHLILATLCSLLTWNHLKWFWSSSPRRRLGTPSWPHTVPTSSDTRQPPDSSTRLRLNRYLEWSEVDGHMPHKYNIGLKRHTGQNIKCVYWRWWEESQNKLFQDKDFCFQFYKNVFILLWIPKFLEI